MKTLPVRARGYVVFVVATGGVVLGLLGELPRLRELRVFLALTLATILTATFKPRLPTTKNRATMSISFVIDFASLLLLGPHKAMLVAGIGAITQSTVRVAHPNPLHRILFNASCLVVTVQVAGAVYRLSGGGPAPFTWPQDVTAVILTVVAYFFVNSWAIAGAVALSTYQPIVRVWQQNFLWGGPSYFIGAAVSALIA